MPTRETPRILYVEDNPGDRFLVQEGLGRLDGDSTLTTASTGEEALELLSEGAVENPPHLALLDLNLPGLSGYDLLRHIRASAAWNELPVVIFSSSDFQEHVEKAYRLGANAFVIKPLELDAFMERVAELYAYWFETAELPPPATDEV